MRNTLLLLARVCLAALFIVAGAGKAMNPAGFAANLEKMGMFAPMLVAYGVIALEILGGLAILLGVATLPVALVMAAFTVATAFVGHLGDTTAMLKNLAIAGGFLALAAAGAGAHAAGGQR